MNKKLNKEEVIKLYVDENKSSSEIAEILGIKQSQVTNFIFYNKIRKGGMASHKKNIDKNILYDLYINKGKGKYEIAKELGVTFTTLQKIIDEYQMKKPEKYNINQIKKWYLDDKKTAKEIGNLIGVGNLTVIRLLRREGVEIRPKGNIPDKEYHLASRFKQEVKDVDKLIKLYKECIPIIEISKELGVGVNAIYRKVDELKLIRPKSMMSRKRYDDSKDKEIIKLYESGLSSVEISDILHISHRAVLLHLRHNGIDPRNLSKSQFTKNKKEFPKELESYETLYDMYVIQKLTKKDLAKTLGVGANVINRCLKKYGIHVRNNSESKIGVFVGDKHPNWKGGRSGLYARLREYFRCHLISEVVKRDGKKCQLCGSTHNLHVHHIRHFKDIFEEILNEYTDLDIKENEDELYDIMINDYRMNDLNNLITYCKECHLFKVHGYKKAQDR